MIFFNFDFVSMPHTYTTKEKVTKQLMPNKEVPRMFWVIWSLVTLSLIGTLLVLKGYVGRL